MVFSSNVFLFFFLAITILPYFLLQNKYRNYFLLIASLLFYAWGEPRFVFIMIASTLMNYLAGMLIGQSKRQGTKRFLLVIAVILNIVLLVVFKYTNFIISNINLLLGKGKELIPQTKIALPIGISFFTFQAMSYVIDVYRGDADVQKNPLYLTLYISFFPQLIAGPIVRYADIAEQMEHRIIDRSNLSEGIKRFIFGFNKKVLIANSMAYIADKAFSTDMASLSSSMAWLGAIAYAFQIFFDFSGYSDMAIGLGKMFGFKFLENFNYPYISKSVSEFWRRWHISLGTWFREYVYFPLGGSRVKTKRRLVFNLFVVWSLTGIWHGANWTFLIWGLLYFVLLSFEKITNLPFRLKTRGGVVIYRLFTLFCVLMGWVVFRAESIGDATRYIATMLSFSKSSVNSSAQLYFREIFVYLIVAVLFSMPLKQHILRAIRQPVLKRIFLILSTVLLFAFFMISIAFLSVSSYNPFIYFNF